MSSCMACTAACAGASSQGSEGGGAHETWSGGAAWPERPRRARADPSALSKIQCFRELSAADDMSTGSPAKKWRCERAPPCASLITVCRLCSFKFHTVTTPVPPPAAMRGSPAPVLHAWTPRVSEDTLSGEARRRDATADYLTSRERCALACSELPALQLLYQAAEAGRGAGPPTASMHHSVHHPWTAQGSVESITSRQAVLPRVLRAYMRVQSDARIS